MDADDDPTAAGTGLPGDPALDRWLSELRTDEAARARSRVASLRAHAAEDATVVGVLADLHERGATVVVSTTHGRRHRGEVLVVGPDAVVLRVAEGEWLVARLATVASVRSVGGDVVTGESPPTTTSRFSRLLGAAAEPGEWLRVLVGGEVLAGTVVSFSADVAVLHLENGDLSYVNLEAVEEASLLAGDV